MDAATIVVLMLTAGVVALLAWFEINSRRNTPKMESESTLTQTGVETLKEQNQIENVADTQRKKAA